LFLATAGHKAAAWIDNPAHVSETIRNAVRRDATFIQGVPCTPPAPPPVVILDNPPGLYDPAPHGYSQVAVVKPGAKWLWVAGQGGETQDGIWSPDFRVLATHMQVANGKLNGQGFPDSQQAPALRDLAVS